VQVGASVGVALFPDHASGEDAREALIRAADKAMYRAKKGGKNRVELASG
jgi:diguanylate cyclase (GGDEF)-like protein